MKIPKTLKIGGHIFEVILKDRNRDGGSNPASINTGICKIWIDNKQAKSQVESSLIHEIIEAIDYLYGLDLEHKQIEVIESAFYQVLKDNSLLK